MRKKKHPEHVNHERWLVSYADFITLLFAFFVVMFAVSQVDSNKVGRFTESFSKAVGIAVFPYSGHGILPGIEGVVTETRQRGSNDPPIEVNLEELHAILLSAAARDEGMADIQIIRRRNEFVLRLPETILFASGDDSVKEAAIRTLRALAVMLRARPVDVRVEGHTDNRPIRTSRFRSNWELSTARATAVLLVMLDGEGLAPERASAAGYGEFHPIAPNDTDAGRSLNRRVDVVVSIHVDAPDAEEAADEHHAARASVAQSASDASVAVTDASATISDASEAPVAPSHDASHGASHEPSHGATGEPAHAASDASAHSPSSPAEHTSEHAEHTSEHRPAHHSEHASEHAHESAPERSSEHGATTDASAPSRENAYGGRHFIEASAR